MELKPIQFKYNGDGTKIAVCSTCDGETFHITVMENGHNHIQCSNPFCNEVYCQGQGPHNDIFCETK